jgi:hypothetical protein
MRGSRGFRAVFEGVGTTAIFPATIDGGGNVVRNAESYR